MLGDIVDIVMAVVVMSISGEAKSGGAISFVACTVLVVKAVQ